MSGDGWTEFREEHHWSVSPYESSQGLGRTSRECHCIQLVWKNADSLLHVGTFAGRDAQEHMLVNLSMGRGGECSDV